MAKSFKTTITTKGPFFRYDPTKTFANNVHTMMLAIARVGAEDVQGQLRAGQGGREPIRQLSGHVSDYVRGELRRYPKGPGYSAKVFVMNRGLTRVQGISLMAAASFLEGTVGAFRRTQGRIMRARAVNAKELLKGLQ